MTVNRAGSRTAATSKIEHFMKIINSIIDVAAVLDPPLLNTDLYRQNKLQNKSYKITELKLQEVCSGHPFHIKLFWVVNHFIIQLVYYLQ